MTQNEQNGERENPRSSETQRGETQHSETQYGEVQPDEALLGEARSGYLPGGNSLPEDAPDRDTVGEAASDGTASDPGSAPETSFEGRDEHLPGSPGTSPSGCVLPWITARTLPMSPAIWCTPARATIRPSTT